MQARYVVNCALIPSMSGDEGQIYARSSQPSVHLAALGYNLSARLWKYLAKDLNQVSVKECGNDLAFQLHIGVG